MNFQAVHLQLHHLTLSLVIKNVGNISTDIGEQKTIRNTSRHQPIIPQHGTTVFEGTVFNNRFPYFSSAILLVADDIVLSNSHNDIIKEQLNVTL